MRNQMLCQLVRYFCILFLLGGSAAFAQCNNIQMSFSPSTISASGGSGVATVTYINTENNMGLGCGGLSPFTSSQSWITFNPMELNCRFKSTDNITVYWTCTEPFTVAENSGSSRSAVISATLHDSGTLITLSQVFTQN